MIEPAELSQFPAIGESSALVDVIATFIFAYPFVTSLLWCLSSLMYLLGRRLARRHLPPTAPPARYSVVIPFHAEPEGALATARSLSLVTPPPVEIIIIDDGSPVPINPETILPTGTRIVRFNHNRGKAGALQRVLPTITTEIVVCMDADTVNCSADWHCMLAAFSDPSLAAVTGKIRPKAGGGVVEWFQALDYLTVIAVIKAAETTWGGLLTVSGAFTAYRVSALRSVGGWSTASSTEDIDASWRLQAASWRLAFESDWTSQVEMAPTVKALWRQRRRWSAGLGRALRDHGVKSFVSSARHLPILVVTLSSLAWMTSVLGLVVLFVLNQLTLSSPVLDVGQDRIALLFVAGLLAFYAQLVTALAVDGCGFGVHWRSVLLAPFYPAYFWVILLTSFLAGFPKGFLRHDKGNWQRTQRRLEAQVTS
jgi:cellulose synthase/poly-beta-1,6-N-acetylglucosamine synthase-like glycosyltransferase